MTFINMNSYKTCKSFGDDDDDSIDEEDNNDDNDRQ